MPAPVRDGRGKKSSVDTVVGSKSDGLRAWPAPEGVFGRTRRGGGGPVNDSSSDEKDESEGETEGRSGGFSADEDEVVLMNRSGLRRTELSTATRREVDAVVAPAELLRGEVEQLASTPAEGDVDRTSTGIVQVCELELEGEGKEADCGG